ncbi:histidinol-phosphate aminotransferase [Hydrobacter penzbergensis]|uniref:Histidinol-phosphate aminotransferase n=1 Tax=Hydrobacter penzbergensis TaxID=1235997 RepID=A0A8X8IFD3_9BACT|nr:histidinol-phosphate transaminase [Hydrobacter penzbergensis]SDW86228.1 histidinol-phosphate aminotransferase [Hydrobacter penzbergensis]
MLKARHLVSQINRPAPETLKRESLMRLDKNERTTLFSETEFNKIMSSITPFDLVAYSELEPTYEAFVKWLNIDRWNIILSPGSDAAIRSIYETYIEPGNEIINYDPNYAMFSVYAKLFGATEIVKKFKNDFSVDVDELIASISTKTKMVIISNPGHNGTVTSVKDIMRVIETAEQFNTIVLVDEAYYHFNDVTLVDKINDKSNLIITRTLSKAFGLAAIRVGYILANQDVIKDIYRIKLVHEIDGVSSKIAKYMVENDHIMKSYVNTVREGRELISERFSRMGITLFPSQSNFVYFDLNRKIDTPQLIKKLQEHDIYIKTPIRTAPFDKYLRITIGSATQMEVFCDRLETFI